MISYTIVCHVHEFQDVPKYALVPGDFSEFDGAGLNWVQPVGGHTVEDLERLGDFLYNDGESKLEYMSLDELWRNVHERLRREHLTHCNVTCITVEG